MQNRELKINLPGKSGTQKTIVNRPPNQQSAAAVISNSIVNPPPTNHNASHSQSVQNALEMTLPSILGDSRLWKLSGDKLTLDMDFDKNAKFDVDANGKLTITFSPQFMQQMHNDITNGNMNTIVPQIHAHQAHLISKALGGNVGNVVFVGP
jgi:uncharacterized lipoprotein YddW (UPF0748 family)